MRDDRGLGRADAGGDRSHGVAGVPRARAGCAATRCPTSRSRTRRRQAVQPGHRHDRPRHAGLLRLHALPRRLPAGAERPDARRTPAARRRPRRRPRSLFVTTDPARDTADGPARLPRPLQPGLRRADRTAGDDRAAAASDGGRDHGQQDGLPERRLRRRPRRPGHRLRARPGAGRSGPQGTPVADMVADIETLAGP